MAAVYSFVYPPQSPSGELGDANRQQELEQHEGLLGTQRRAGLGDERVLFKLFGGSDALRAYALSLHRGARDWPETLDLGWGFFTSKTQEKVAAEQGQATFTIRFVAPDRLLRLVSEITGCGLDELSTSVMGPRANPARRFAVWAFRKHTRLKSKGIAGILNRSYNQVSNVLSRFKAEPGEMSKWTNDLDTACDK